MMNLPYIVSQAFLAIVGGIGNVLLLVTLQRDKKLRKCLSSIISVIMGAQAIVDATFCLIGVPLTVINREIGVEGVAALGNWFCYAVQFTSWRLVKLSFAMLWSLATTRFVAVYMPLLYRRYASSTAVTIAAVAVPIGMSQAVFVYGMITNWIRVKPLAGVGSCFPYVVNNKNDSSVVSYAQLEVLTTSTALPCALVLYLLVWTRLFWQRLRTIKVAAGGAVASGGNAAKCQRKLQRDRVRLMTIVFTVNLVLVLPSQVTFFAGFKPWMAKSAPLAFAFIDWLLFLAIGINPLVYVAVSSEMGAAFKRTLTLA